MVIALSSEPVRAITFIPLITVHSMKTSTLTSRLLAIVAAFSFVFSAAAYDFTVDGVYYNITGDNTVEVTSKTTSSGGYTGEVTVPASVTNGGVNYQVTAVGDKAFYVCSNVTGVTCRLPSPQLVRTPSTAATVWPT